jgi:adenylylsulfate kinase-like enzyme
MVIWITGLSGSGKSTIGQEIWLRLREIEPNTVLVDGDRIREVLGLDKGDENYTIAARQKVAERIYELCRWLDEQKVNVVCCTISLFEDLHRLNRKNLSNYFEVFMDVPLDILKRRDFKGLYSGKIPNVVGLDIPYSKPLNPDLTIDNSEDRESLNIFVERILEQALMK